MTVTSSAALTPWAMFLAADAVVKTVMLLLVLASLLTWTVLLARARGLGRLLDRLRRTRDGLRQTASLPSEGALPPGSEPARSMLAEAWLELQLSGELADHSGTRERIASRLERIEVEAGREQQAGVGMLASIGAVAPFVGLLGTVWGIMNSFVGIAASHASSLAVVAPGIAQALLATAMGLVAAIPAVLIYNHFTRRLVVLRGLLGDVSAAIQQLVSRDMDRAAGQGGARSLRGVA